MTLSEVLARYRPLVGSVVHREPDSTDRTRWRQHRIGGREYRIAQPVTFTPYASVRSCSARCRFCSENLRERRGSRHSSLLRPWPDYFFQLETALRQLQGLPLSYSLSGLEVTDDRNWFLQLMEVLSRHQTSSPVNDKVLYSNGSGLVDAGQDMALMKAMRDFGFSWFELSRHHYDDQHNQNIMRFREKNRIVSNGSFRQVLDLAGNLADVKLVCIVQRGGIDSLPELVSYLAWSKRLGIKQVIFRELSELDDHYQSNGTFRYIARSRVSVASLLCAFLEWAAVKNTVALRRATLGYYFQNLVVGYDGMNITFEASSYADLRTKHDSGKVFKLVFHANGNLCADWDPERHVLYATGQEERCHAQ